MNIKADCYLKKFQKNLENLSGNCLLNRCSNGGLSQGPTTTRERRQFYEETGVSSGFDFGTVSVAVRAGGHPTGQK